MRERSSRLRGKAALRQRGRTVVIALFLASALAQTGLSYAANLVWPGLRDPLYFDKEQKLSWRAAERTTAAGRPLTVVMFGSSRTLGGLDGQTLEQELSDRLHRPTAALNFGITAAGPIANAINVQRLFEAGHRPDLVLIEVFPPYFFGGDGPPREHYFLTPERLQAHEVARVLEFGYAAGETRWRWLWSALVPGYSLRFPILGRVAPKWLPTELRYDWGRNSDPTGWGAYGLVRVTSEEYRRGVAFARHQHFDFLQQSRLARHSVQALRASLSCCRECSVRAALVLMPEGSDFRAWYPPATSAALARLLDDVGSEFDVPLIDAREWLTDDAFSDSHHLLPSGAKSFTQRLGQELAGLAIDPAPASGADEAFADFPY